MPRRIFVVGAGASRDDTKRLQLPMPLACDFFDYPYIAEYWPKHNEGFTPFADSALLRVIKHYFGSSVQKTKNGCMFASGLNVEEVYSFIQTGLDVYSAHFLDRSLLMASRTELLTYIQHVVANVPWDVKSPRLHGAVVSSLKKEDSILTFNWDLFFDRCLAMTEGGSEYLALQQQMLDPIGMQDNQHACVDLMDMQQVFQGCFLKLHGSINWGTCGSAECLRHSMPYVFPLGEECIEVWHCDQCGSPMEVTILPPYVQKSYSAVRYLRLQANLAIDKLRTAAEIVVLGYSMPAFDYQARTLVRTARLEAAWAPGDADLHVRRLVVVNPDVRKKAFVNQLKDVFGLDTATTAYGHPIELVLYPSVSAYLRKELP